MKTHLAVFFTAAALVAALTLAGYPADSGINALVLRVVVTVTTFVWPHRLAWLAGALFVIGTAAAFWGLRLRRERRRVAASE